MVHEKSVLETASVEEVTYLELVLETMSEEEGLIGVESNIDPAGCIRGGGGIQSYLCIGQEWTWHL